MMLALQKLNKYKKYDKEISNIESFMVNFRMPQLKASGESTKTQRNVITKNWPQKSGDYNHKQPQIMLAVINFLSYNYAYLDIHFIYLHFAHD